MTKNLDAENAVLTHSNSWTDKTILKLLYNFIDSKDLAPELDGFLEEIADEEQDEDEEDGFFSDDEGFLEKTSRQFD